MPTAPLFSTSGAYARGNENNQHEADGTYYLGPGKSDSYAVVNLGARHQVHPRIRLYVQVNNLFDSQYYTAAQLATTGFTSIGSFIARPLPPVEGECHGLTPPSLRRGRRGALGVAFGCGSKTVHYLGLNPGSYGVLTPEK